MVKCISIGFHFNLVIKILDISALVFLSSYRQPHIWTKMFGKLLWVFKSILDRHHAWRSLDPTLGIWSIFVKERRTFNKDASFLLHLHIISSVIRPVIRPVICMVVWCVPICFNRFSKWKGPLFSLVLPVLTIQYIKSSNGDL